MMVVVLQVLPLGRNHVNAIMNTCQQYLMQQEAAFNYIYK